MKKFLIMLLAITATFSFVACGAADSDKDGDNTPAGVVQPVDDGGENSGENGGTGGNCGGNQGGEQNPDTNVVQPISNGGGFEFN